jgi:uncharacterized SAM-binding protein YcdF (DUF218 family)
MCRRPQFPRRRLWCWPVAPRGHNLLLQQGWERLETAANLYADGFAPVVVISGGGASDVSEAEIYANAAAWLGIPRQAMRLETGAQRTADHGKKLRGYTLADGTVVGPGGRRCWSVTSAFHTRRARASFIDAGLTRVRLVSRHTARPIHPRAGEWRRRPRSDGSGRTHVNRGRASRLRQSVRRSALPPPTPLVQLLSRFA